jgi:exo-beta-1,3-glucanase (GH17 family)
MVTLCASVALAACEGSNDAPRRAPLVTVGGTVTGLAGTVTLQNSGGNDLTVAANGPFTFTTLLAPGAAYAVSVQAQPAGQTCTVMNGSGIASGNVTSVTVECVSNPTIGGTISGLSGVVVLQNNGGNSFSTAANGPFTFTDSVAPGAAYSVTVQTQPAGQTCTVTNDSGTASGNVTNVAVLCVTPAGFSIRPLPDLYTTGKAVNYSAYRAGGPGVGEVPSDANVLQDLGLVSNAGYNLLRIFGSDAVGEKVLRLAAENYPDLRFQLGIFLNGLPPGAACDSSSITASQITTAIRLAGQYPNVATVSVGNETSFYRGFLPITCLEGYIQTVRSQVTQPVTTDDDHTFYARAESDPILRLIDFVSIHTYPFSYTTQWDWRQTGTVAGPARAAAMMNAAFNNARSTFEQVAGRQYLSAAGVTERIDASLPVIVGETGWKARQTNPAAEIETYAANPVNEKWYFDLVYAWERTLGGPKTVFFFQPFDETWKGIDDGWGLWDKDRVPRYALCGTPAGAACNSDIYQGAGFYPL